MCGKWPASFEGELRDTVKGFLRAVGPQMQRVQCEDEALQLLRGPAAATMRVASTQLMQLAKVPGPAHQYTKCAWKGLCFAA